MNGKVQLYTNCAECIRPPREGSIPWLTFLPEHWKVIRSKRLFAARKEKARPDDQQLSATQAYGVILQKEFEKRVGRKVVQIIQHLEKRAHVEPDDFVISMRSFQGGLERAWARGCIRSSYVVLSPSSLVNIGYFTHLFKCKEYICALQATANFIRDGQDLNFSNFCLVDLPLPPYEEQKQIAQYLDWQAAKIQKFIKAKRKLIALLKEQKQNFINAAVIKGINPNVKMKDSGVDWLGEIPEHWEVLPIKRISHVVTGYAFNSELFSKSGVPVIRIGDVKSSGKVDIENSAFLPYEFFEKHKKFAVQKDDLAMAMTGATIGKVSKYTHDTNALLNQRVCVFRSKNELALQNYLFCLLRSPIYLEQVKQSCYGGAQPNISDKTLVNFKMPIAPLDEQHKMVELIEQETALIDITIFRTEREIELIQEYRTSLISNVVTGKVDIRSIRISDFETNETSTEEFTKDESEDKLITEGLEK